jgi:hypothetical protein
LLVLNIRTLMTSMRPNITIFFTFLAVGISFAWLGVDNPENWRAGVALYILGCKLFFASRSTLTRDFSDNLPGSVGHMA